jgi:hypothetical protein
MALLACRAAAAEPAPVQADTSPDQVALAWLRSQIVPNDLVSTPDPRRRGLILSYAPGTKAPGPLHRKSAAYDGALAAIAFSLHDQWADAARVLNALTRVQRQGGSFWFSYNTHNSWPDELDHDMAILRAGAIGWVGYAFIYYLENKPPSGDARSARERRLFLASAKQAADYLLGLRVTDRPLARGLVRGGNGEVRLTVAKDSRGVVEVYQDRPIGWVSTEHNISAYFFLSGLARVSGDSHYQLAAQAIRDRLLSVLWQDDLGQFAQGINPDGTLDRMRALDCASWGALFLLSTGEKQKAKVALETADRLYRNTHGGIQGHRPYYDKAVYEDARVQRILLPDAPQARWKDLSFIWSEGSLGVALAQIRAGNKINGTKLAEEMLKLTEKGGIRYGSRELPFEFSSSPSVAGTAWYLIVRDAVNHPKGKGLWTQ